jgi:predicted Zn-dependent peptidase
MIQNPLLDSVEIEREKGVIKEEINMYEDTPQRKVGEIYENLLYPGHPLGFDIAGTKEIVDNFTRQTFINYINSLYHPNNAVLVVAGGLNQKSKFKGQNNNLKVKSYKEIIESKLGNWKSGGRINFLPIKENQIKPQILIKYKKTEQAHFVLGFRSFSFYDRRKYAQQVLSVILGGGMSSRLFIQVRERKGLCYYISTGAESYHDCGSFTTQAGVTNDLDKIKLAIKTILEEHKKIVDGDVSKKELIRAKELIKGRVMLSLEDSINVANIIGIKKLLQDKIETPEEIIKKIEAVTLDEITKLAQQIFINRSLNFSLIGPFDKTKDFENVVTI